MLGAAPQLRLAGTTVGPVSIAAGANGPAQTVEAYNNGDGALNLGLASSVAWAVPAVGAQRPCQTRSGNCLPIQIAFQTTALAKGVYTGIVTVSDPNAYDAPQTITVTVQIGGGVPDRIDFYLPPRDGSADSRFYTNSAVVATPSTLAGGAWLSASLEGLGTFRFALPYSVRASYQPGMAEGTYTGALAVNGSGFAADNKTVPVTLRVTSQPIIDVQPAKLQFRIAPGSPAQLNYINAYNRGLTTLSLSDATFTPASGGSWLKLEVLPAYSLVSATADAGSLAPGVYSGTVTIASNAVNGTQTVPVELQVLASGPPVAFFNGAVKNTTYEGDESLPKGGIVSLFGEKLITGAPENSPAPLPIQLGEATVYVNDVAVPLFYVSYGQINFQMPFDAPSGDVRIRVDRAGQRGNTITARVEDQAPRIIPLGIGEYGTIINQDGSFVMPATPGLLSHPAKPGDVLVIYSLGLGPTDVKVANGAGSPAAEPLARVSGTIVTFGGVGIFGGSQVVPLFSGLTPNYVGLYQVNVTVPADIPRGDQVRLRLEVYGNHSNVVYIAVQ